MAETIIKLICKHCKNEFDCRLSKYNASIKGKYTVYCSYECSHLGRRSQEKPVEQRKAEKQAYDKERRKIHGERLKQQKREAYKKNFDPVKAAEYRKKRMPYHVEYCRRPEYKAKKVEYDQQYRAKKFFGEFYESAILLERIAEIVDNREANQLKGTFNKSQNRKRSWLKKQKTNLPQLP